MTNIRSPRPSLAVIFNCGPDVACNIMLSYLFLCCDSIATLPVLLFRLFPVFSCVQSVHIPESPAEILSLSHRFWTLITFFWLDFFQPYFGESRIYIIHICKKYHISKVCSKTAQPQRSQFLFLWTSSISVRVRIQDYPSQTFSIILNYLGTSYQPTDTYVSLIQSLGIVA